MTSTYVCVCVCDTEYCGVFWYVFMHISVQLLDHVMCSMESVITCVSKTFSTRPSASAGQDMFWEAMESPAVVSCAACHVSIQFVMDCPCVYINPSPSRVRYGLLGPCLSTSMLTSVHCAWPNPHL